jgi:FMN-dependent NADH-azoreductase
VDASQNTLENFNVIMPTVFGTLGIPESKTIYVDEVAAQEAAKQEQAAQAAAKKKSMMKKSK